MWWGASSLLCIKGSYWIDYWTFREQRILKYRWWEIDPITNSSTGRNIWVRWFRFDVTVSVELRISFQTTSGKLVMIRCGVFLKDDLTTLYISMHVSLSFQCSISPYPGSCICYWDWQLEPLFEALLPIYAWCHRWDITVPGRHIPMKAIFPTVRPGSDRTSEKLKHLCAIFRCAHFSDDYWMIALTIVFTQARHHTTIVHDTEYLGCRGFLVQRQLNSRWHSFRELCHKKFLREHKELQCLSASFSHFAGWSSSSNPTRSLPTQKHLRTVTYCEWIESDLTM